MWGYTYLVNMIFLRTAMMPRVQGVQMKNAPCNVRFLSFSLAPTPYNPPSPSPSTAIGRICYMITSGIHTNLIIHLSPILNAHCFSLPPFLTTQCIHFTQYAGRNIPFSTNELPADRRSLMCTSFISLSSANP